MMKVDNVVSLTVILYNRFWEYLIQFDSISDTTRHETSFLDVKFNGGQVGLC